MCKHIRTTGPFPSDRLRAPVITPKKCRDSVKFCWIWKMWSPFSDCDELTTEWKRGQENKKLSLHPHAFKLASPFVCFLSQYPISSPASPYKTSILIIFLTTDHLAPVNASPTFTSVFSHFISHWLQDKASIVHGCSCPAGLGCSCCFDL